MSRSFNGHNYKPGRKEVKYARKMTNRKARKSTKLMIKAGKDDNFPPSPKTSGWISW